MGIGGISIWQLLIILVIVLLLFGTKKLRNLGSDLGSSIKSFKKAVKEGDPEEDARDQDEAPAIEEDSAQEGSEPTISKKEEEKI